MVLSFQQGYGQGNGSGSYGGYGQSGGGMWFISDLMNVCS